MGAGKVGLAFGVLWLGYAVGFTGYVLVKGYNIPIAQIWSPLNWYDGPWPPAAIDPTQVWPDSAKKATGPAVTVV